MTKNPANEKQNKLSDLIEIIRGYKDLDLSKKEDYKQKFNKVWPVAKKTIEFARDMKITGEKFDKVATEVISLGERMYKGTASEEDRTELSAKFHKTWKKIKLALKGLKFISDPEKDKVIDKIIEIGDWMFGF